MMTRTEHLLTIAAEECSEIAQRISKAIRFGLKEVQPGQERTNAERIMVEFADLCVVMEHLVNDGDLDEDTVDYEKFYQEKSERLEKFIEHARKCGTVL